MKRNIRSRPKEGKWMAEAGESMTAVDESTKVVDELMAVTIKREWISKRRLLDREKSWERKYFKILSFKF